MAAPGRPAKIGEEHREFLRTFLTAHPTSTLAEIAAALKPVLGVDVHPATVRKALREFGMVRVRAAAMRSAAQPSSAPRCGSNETHRRHTPEQRYPSCLTDAEWGLVADLFERDGGRGRPAQVSRRALVDACCYVVRSGCAWRRLPREFPTWHNVYKTFRRWSAAGTFERRHDRLRAAWRERVGRAAAPTAAVLDAQSTRGSPQGGPSGFDAGKQVKGRQRSLVVDTLGLVLAVSVSAANLQDRDAGWPAIARAAEQYPSVATPFADSAYAGAYSQRIEHDLGMHVEIVHHPGSRRVGRWIDQRQPDLLEIRANADGFVPLPKRWVVDDRSRPLGRGSHRTVLGRRCWGARHPGLFPRPRLLPRSILSLDRPCLAGARQPTRTTGQPSDEKNPIIPRPCAGVTATAADAWSRQLGR